MKFAKQKIYYSPTQNEIFLVLFYCGTKWKVVIYSKNGSRYTTPFVYFFHLPDDAILLDDEILL